mmetsp:Transcript_31508/g.81520  ORF Transcript_31508/g.81520 Transcript_31508/m.81520 type:complete len:381 (-) Transcript_31508:431-1573(-)
MSRNRPLAVRPGAAVGVVVQSVSRGVLLGVAVGGAAVSGAAGSVTPRSPRSRSCGASAAEQFGVLAGVVLAPGDCASCAISPRGGVRTRRFLWSRNAAGFTLGALSASRLLLTAPSSISSASRNVVSSSWAQRGSRRRLGESGAAVRMLMLAGRSWMSSARGSMVWCIQLVPSASWTTSSRPVRKNESSTSSSSAGAEPSSPGRSSQSPTTSSSPSRNTASSVPSNSGPSARSYSSGGNCACVLMSPTVSATAGTSSGVSTSTDGAEGARSGGPASSSSDSGTTSSSPSRNTVSLAGRNEGVPVLLVLLPEPVSASPAITAAMFSCRSSSHQTRPCGVGASGQRLSTAWMDSSVESRQGGRAAICSPALVSERSPGLTWP